MDLEVLKSYLVDLGFDVNQPELKKFEGGLQQAAQSVTSHTTGIAKDVLKWQTAVTGLFTGVSAAVIAAADHVAMTDQSYRLMGLRMFMTTESARKLQVGLNTLGASLEEIAWDPELNKRFLQLSQDQDKLAKGLGSNFSADMRGVRDLRFEFSRLHVALEYLSMRVVSSLFESFGLTIGGVKEKLAGVIDWITQNLPAAGDAIAKQLLPILRETWTIVQELGTAFGETGVLFTNLVGLLSGDKSIQGTALDFEKMAGAVSHVVDFLGDVIHAVVTAETMLVHFANAVTLGLSGKFGEAKDELLAGMKQLNAATGTVIGGVAGAGAGATAMGLTGAAWGTAFGPAGTLIGGLGGAGLGALLGGAAGADVGGVVGDVKQAIAPSDDRVPLTVEFPKTAFPVKPAAEATNTRDIPPAITIENQLERAPYTPPKTEPATSARGEIQQIIVREAQKDGIDPRIALAVAKQESGQRQFNRDGSIVSSGKAVGVMQLTPVTAKDLHVDPRDTRQNIQGGVAYLAEQLQRFHNDLPKALAAYNMGPNGLDKAIARHQALPAETSNYVKSIMSNLRAGGSTVTVGDVHVSVSGSNRTPEEIEKAVTKGVVAAVSKQTQRNLAQMSYLG